MCSAEIKNRIKGALCPGARMLCMCLVYRIRKLVFADFMHCSY